MRFDGKTVVVTGGTGALGRAVVEAIVREGGRCVVPVHGEAPRAAGTGNVAYRGGVDLTEEGAVARFYAGVGTLWASVHAAGGFAMGPIAEQTQGDFAKMIQTNTLTAFLCSREAIKAIRRGGAGEGGGRIVNVAAKVGLTPVGGMTAYVASKAALVGLTLGLAEEVAGEGIWVNAVAPSIMDTPANRASFPAGTDFAKWPSVADVAATILFLASAENRVTRGAVVPVYGRA